MSDHSDSNMFSTTFADNNAQGGGAAPAVSSAPGTQAHQTDGAMTHSDADLGASGGGYTLSRDVAPTETSMAAEGLGKKRKLTVMEDNISDSDCCFDDSHNKDPSTISHVWPPTPFSREHLRDVSIRLLSEETDEAMGQLKKLQLYLSDPTKYARPECLLDFHPEFDEHEIPEVASEASVETEEEKRKRRKLKAEMRKLGNGRGAIFAPSRTAEGFKLTAGNQLSCMTDALENAMKMDGFPENDISTAKIRKLAIPELGNERMASFLSCKDALQSLNLPYDLLECTSKFKVGPPMLNLLLAKSGVYVLGLRVVIDGVTNKHCIAYSAKKGKLVDNGSRTRPLYIEEKDRRSKKTAKDAFRKLVEQKCGSDHFALDLTQVYEVVRRAA